ncbi:MAG: AtpZ/AtpI family protein [Proteobacteria bacterium]|nr:AtpZ/AtpI family protein [Pseudomonadota bacterium]
MSDKRKRTFNFRDNRNWSEGLTIVMQLGLNMAGSIIFFFFVGFYMDKWFSTKGLFTTVFTILGVVGGGYTTYRQIMEITEGKHHRKNNGND